MVFCYEILMLICIELLEILWTHCVWKEMYVNALILFYINSYTVHLLFTRSNHSDYKVNRYSCVLRTVFLVKSFLCYFVILRLHILQLTKNYSSWSKDNYISFSYIYEKPLGKYKQVCHIFLNEQTNTHTLNLFTDYSVHGGYAG